jgi:hypothetical protein
MKYIIVTDLDNTLVGDDQATKILNQKLIAKRQDLYLIYATGRSYGSAVQLMNEKQLLEPDYWVTGVGTEIYHQSQRDIFWENKISEQWKPQNIISIAQSFKQLLPQSLQEQNPWKISFCLNQPQNSSILEELKTQLNELGLVYQMIFSSSRDIDIVPRNANKGLAITYLRKLLDIQVESTLVFGDSGNDINLFEQLTLGTIVGNAQPELIKWYEKNMRPSLYWATRSYAWGILEGLEYFQLLK